MQHKTKFSMHHIFPGPGLLHTSPPPPATATTRPDDKCNRDTTTRSSIPQLGMNLCKTQHPTSQPAHKLTFYIVCKPQGEPFRKHMTHVPRCFQEVLMSITFITVSSMLAPKLTQTCCRELQLLGIGWSSTKTAGRERMHRESDGWMGT